LPANDTTTMSDIKAHVEHRTVEPRLDSEATVEEVIIHGQDTITVRFTRIGECIDAWEFEELIVDAEVFTDPSVALTKRVAQAVLKRTPCVSIRDRDNDTIAGIEYSDELDHQTSFYTIE